MLLEAFNGPLAEVFALFWMLERQTLRFLANASSFHQPFFNYEQAAEREQREQIHPVLGQRAMPHY
jgi:hypothetical protein